MLTRTCLCFLAFLLLLPFRPAAQETEPDSLYTVLDPPGYRIPAHRLDTASEAAVAVEEEIYEEIVPGALSDPDMYQLQFDTTMATELYELDLEDYYVPRVSEALIKDRLSCLENEVPLNYHERVKVFIDFYSVRRRDFTLRVMQRKNIYFPIFERVLAEYNMPDELKYLAIIESALIPTARSRVGALGLWQFMPATGKMFGLQQSAFLDERQDPEQATRAACQYLRQLYNMFDDWELAIAAYNCGPGNIRKAKRRSGNQRHFWEVYQYLPRETRSYLPQLVAMIYVLNHTDEHHLIQDQPDYPIDYATVEVDGLVNLAVLAQELHVCAEDLLLLNPSLKRGVVPPYSQRFPLRIPKARLDHFQSHREAILAEAAKGSDHAELALINGTPDPRYDGIYYHIVRKGESLGLIAARNGVTVGSLKEWNKLPDERIYPGQKLAVYSSAAGRSGGGSSAGGGGTAEFHTVRRGEVLGSIARRHRVYVSQIKAWNGLRSDNIYVGQRLRVRASSGGSAVAKSETATAPAASSTPQNTGTSTASASHHVVKSGDTLSEIAAKYGIGLSELRQLNGLSGNNIRVGQRLKLRGTAGGSTSAGKTSVAAAGTYVVKSGDSLWVIAKKVGVPVEDLKRLNGLTSNALQVGQRLKLR